MLSTTGEPGVSGIELVKYGNGNSTFDMEQKYALEWLDFMVTVTLNPTRTDPTVLDADRSDIILSQAGEEADRIKRALQNHTFGLFSKRKIQLLVKQYHDSLVMLLDAACENESRIDAAQQIAKRTCQAILEGIEELLNFIENRFGEYIGFDERVPARYLQQIRKDLRTRVDTFKSDVAGGVDSKKLTDILLHALYSFTNEPLKRVVTYREVFYKKELVKEVEKIRLSGDESKMHDALTELLVCLNFNSRSFMDYYTEKIAQRANSFGPLHEKMNHLLLHFKRFNQMHHKPGVKLNPHYADVRKVIGNWFSQEISYLEKKRQWDVAPLASTQPIKMLPEQPFKVLCFLSVDQIAIIFRAMDSLRIVQSRSLNLIFQTIAPYLSTPHKEEISWKSMRSKSSGFEDNDKDVVIHTLQKIINWIQEY